jgi:hypothetical protein
MALTDRKPRAVRAAMGTPGCGLLHQRENFLPTVHGNVVAPEYAPRRRPASTDVDRSMSSLYTATCMFRTIAVASVVILTACGRWSFNVIDASGRDADAISMDADATGLDAITGLVAWYPMDNAPSSGIVVDGSGHHLDGVCTVGTCPGIASGKIDMAFEFDGISQHITVADDGRLQQTAGFTVTAWVKRSGGTATALSKPLASGVGASWELALTDTDVLFFNTDGIVESLIMAGQPLPLDMWSHIAISWDGAIKRLYVGGVETSSGTKSTVFDSTPLQIGADQEDGVTMSYFHGFLDEVRIYDRALTLAEIRQLYESR